MNILIGLHLSILTLYFSLSSPFSLPLSLFLLSFLSLSSLSLSSLSLSSLSLFSFSPLSSSFPLSLPPLSPSLSPSLSTLTLSLSQCLAGIPIPWSKVARSLPGRTDAKCALRWRQLSSTQTVEEHYKQIKIKEKMKKPYLYMKGLRGKKMSRLHQQLTLDFHVCYIPVTIADYSGKLIIHRRTYLTGGRARDGVTCWEECGYL